MKIFKEIQRCSECQKETLHLIIDGEHERDSSGDSETCLMCGTYFSGYSGTKYVKFYSKEELEELKNETLY